MRLFLLLPFLFLSWQSTAQFGKALLLDGNGDYLRVEDHDDLDISAGEHFSITCWVKALAYTDFYRIACKRGGTTAAFAGYECIIKSNTGEFGVNLRSTSGANAGPPFGNTPLSDGNWHHLAMTADASTGTVRIYVDAQLEQSTTTTILGAQGFENALDLYFGASQAPGLFWNGWLDEIRIWSFALNQEQIAADQLTQVTGNEPGLLAAWDFENSVGQIVPDLTGNHPGTLFGNASTSVPTAVDMTLLSTNSYHPDFPVGQGATAERLLSVNFKTIGGNNPIQIDHLQFSLHALTNPNHLSQFRLYSNGNQPRLQLSTAQLLGEAASTNGQLVFNGPIVLSEGDNYFWLVADIQPTAEEGASIGADFSGYTANGQWIGVPVNPNSPDRTILLEHTLLFSGGDFGSAAWRIPAIAARGNQVVAVADARITTNGDLPNNIDLVARTSNDKGQTWSAPITIADFGNQGASDPALVYDRISGDLLCLFASHAGLFQSTPSNKIRFQVCRSADFGVTWSAPQEFSSQIYLPGWYAAWVASGSAHQLPNGRIVAAVGVRQNAGNTISNFMIYSDDGGYSWQSSPGVASAVGDEAKIVSLEDERLLMLIRSAGLRKASYSSDLGANWTLPVTVPDLVEPAVNGDLIRFSSISSGNTTNRLLFSIASHPNQRKNLTVFVSYDEGASWQTKRVICPGPSAYSALCHFDDGTIGMFYENGEYENYQLYFTRFSLDWLSNGADTWTTTSTQPADNASDPLLKIAPNPASGSINLQFQIPSTQKISLEATDSTGKLIEVLRSETMSQGTYQQTWTPRQTAKGWFVIHLKGENFSTSARVQFH